MPAKLEDYEKASEKADELSIKGADFEFVAGALRSEIMGAVREDRIQRGVSTLAQDVGNVSQKLVTDPAAIRQRAGDVVNPMQVDFITAQQRGANLGHLSEVAAQSEYEQGTLLDIIAENAEVMRARAASLFEEAQREASKASALMQQLQDQEGIRQFNETLAEEQRQFKIRQAGKTAGSGSGGGGGGGVVDKGDEASERWLQSYIQNLPPELRPGFLADLQAYAELGYEDDVIKTILESDYGKERFTPEQQESLETMGEPYKPPLLPGIVEKVQSFLGLDPNRPRRTTGSAKKRGR